MFIVLIIWDCFGASYKGSILKGLQEVTSLWVRWFQGAGVPKYEYRRFTVDLMDAFLGSPEKKEACSDLLIIQTAPFD